MAKFYTWASRIGEARTYFENFPTAFFSIWVVAPEMIPLLLLGVGAIRPRDGALLRWGDRKRRDDKHALIREIERNVVKATAGVRG